MQGVITVVQSPENHLVCIASLSASYRLCTAGTVIVQARLVADQVASCVMHIPVVCCVRVFTQCLAMATRFVCCVVTFEPCSPNPQIHSCSCTDPTGILTKISSIHE